MIEPELKADDLNSGVIVEVLMFGEWRTARAEFDHRIRAYVLYLYDGVHFVGILEINDETRMRWAQ